MRSVPLAPSQAWTTLSGHLRPNVVKRTDGQPIVVHFDKIQEVEDESGCKRSNQYLARAYAALV
jgi:hypothetical protein